MNYEEEFNELHEAVLAMRRAQNLYFNAKKRHIETPAQLMTSKAAESRVDGILKRVSERKNGIQQMLLK